MRRRWLRPSLPLCVVCALLCGALVCGPAMANPTRVAQAQPNDDDDDVPAPPAPPPAPAPAPAPPPPVAAPAPPAGPVYYGQPAAPAPGYGYGYGYGYPAPVHNPYGISPAELYARGGSLKNIGVPLTIAAIVLFALGIGLLVKGAETTTTCGGGSSCTGGVDQYLAWGLVSILGGTVGLGVGIPLWAVGSYRQSRAIKMGFQPTFAQPFVAPVNNGAVAGMRLITF